MSQSSASFINNFKFIMNSPNNHANENISSAVEKLVSLMNDIDDGNLEKPKINLQIKGNLPSISDQ